MTMPSQKASSTCSNASVSSAKLTRHENKLGKTSSLLSECFAFACQAADYIEMFYNPKRKHVRNGMLSPVNFENRQLKTKQEGV